MTTMPAMSASPHGSAGGLTAPEAMAQVVKWRYAMSVQHYRIVNGTNVLGGMQREFDLHFFLIALTNFVAFVKLTGKLVNPERRNKIWQGIRAFESAVPDSGNLRDVLEHYDEYMRGTGKLQTSEKKLAGTHHGAGQRARILVSRSGDSHTITVSVPGVADFSVDIEAAVDASNRLESAVGHSLD